MTVVEFRKFIDNNRKRLLEEGKVRRSSCPNDWTKIVLEAIVERDSSIYTFSQAVKFLKDLGLHIPVSGAVESDEFPGILNEYFTEKMKFGAVIMENE